MVDIFENLGGDRSPLFSLVGSRHFDLLSSQSYWPAGQCQFAELAF